tara:strand:+ start:1063 stop:1296 length:234 start_codon:yes stop_codon:yes gene_type:complete
VTALGREIHTAHTYKERMIAAGFENVTEVIYKWPTNRWPKDKRMKELGKKRDQLFVGLVVVRADKNGRNVGSGEHVE